MEIIEIKSLDQLQTLAEQVLRALALLPATEGPVVLALSGDLGAGKTTFVQALARTLGVSGVVQSPTFVVLKMYETTNAQFTVLAHMDAYRIESMAELAPLRFTELLQQPGMLLCVEWAEKIRAALPSKTICVDFKNEVSEERTVTIRGLQLTA